PGDGVAEGVRDPERPAVARDRQAGDAAIPLTGILELDLVREQAGGVIESVDDLIETPADEQPLAVSRPAQAGERARKCHAADDLVLLRVEGDDLVLAVAGVEDREDRLARMLGQDDRKVAELDLPSGGF